MAQFRRRMMTEPVPMRKSIRLRDACQIESSHSHDFRSSREILRSVTIICFSGWLRLALQSTEIVIAWCSPISEDIKQERWISR